MPRLPKPKGDPEYADLKGAWWKCPVHGLTTDVLVLGGEPYCSEPECTERAPLVHSAMDEPMEASAWNKPTRPLPRRREEPGHAPARSKPAPPTKPKPQESVPVATQPQGPSLKLSVAQFLVDKFPRKFRVHDVQTALDHAGTTTSAGEVKAALSELRREGLATCRGPGWWIARMPGEIANDPPPAKPVKTPDEWRERATEKPARCGDGPIDMSKFVLGVRPEHVGAARKVVEVADEPRTLPKPRMIDGNPFRFLSPKTRALVREDVERQRRNLDMTARLLDELEPQE